MRTLDLNEGIAAAEKVASDPTQCKEPTAIASAWNKVRQVRSSDQQWPSALKWDDDPDWLRQVAADIEYVGERLNVNTQELTQSLAERADEIEGERAEPEPPDDYEGRWESSDSRVDDVQGMFDGLESDLRGG